MPLSGSPREATLGVMPREVDVTCPCCGEPGTVAVEEEEGDAEFVQDCAVCCRPWQVRISIRRDGSADVTVSPEGE
jgi:uncharacterized Zn finger protein